MLEVLRAQAGLPQHAVIRFASKGDRHKLVVFVSAFNRFVEGFVHQLALAVLNVHNLLNGDVFAFLNCLSAAVQKCDDVRVVMQTEISQPALQGEHVLFEIRLVQNHVGLVFYFSVACVIKEEQDSLIHFDRGFYSFL